MTFTCLICLESNPKFATQKLSCDHQFCAQCLSLCAPGLCPYPLCCAPRNMQVFVDELEGVDGGAITFIDKHNRIVFGDRGPNLLKLEERQNLDAKRQKAQLDVRTPPESRYLNVGIVLVSIAWNRVFILQPAMEPMYCPRTRCANQLNRVELAKVAEKTVTTQNSCKQLIANMEPSNPMKNVKRNAKDDCIVSCSIYHVEGSTRTISIPKICTIGGMMSAFTQIYGLGKSGATILRVFIRKVDEAGKVRYEIINSRTMWKKFLQDAKIVEKANLIIDLHNEIDSSQ